MKQNFQVGSKRAIQGNVRRECLVVPYIYNADTLELDAQPVILTPSLIHPGRL